MSSRPAILASILPMPGMVPGFVDQLMKQGLTIEKFFSKAAIDTNLIGSADAYLSIAQLNTFIEVAYGKLSKIDPAFALHFAQTMYPIQAGIVGQLMVSSRTVREILETWIQFKDLAVPMLDIQLNVGNKYVSLNYIVEGANDFIYKHIHHEMVTTSTVCWSRSIIEDQFRLVEIRFNHSAPSYVKDYERIFKVPIKFDCSSNEIIFKKEVLDVKLPFAHRGYYAHNKKIADEQLKAFRVKQSIAAQVQRIMEENMDTTILNLEEVAQHFNIAGRSLQRKLQEEGVAFSDLRDQFRHQLALKYLHSPISNKLDMTRIAHKLGFAHVGGFYSAFKRVQGQTPGKYRKHYFAEKSPRLLRTG